MMGHSFELSIGLASHAAWRVTVLGPLAWLGLLLSALAVHAQPSRPTLPLEDRTNGHHTLAVLNEFFPAALACVVHIEDSQGKTVCAATIVDGDGYVLMKASELPELKHMHVKLVNGRAAGLREIRRDSRMDLLLAQAIGVTGLKAANFGGTRSLAHGQWLCSGSGKNRALRIGIVSANRRRVPGLGAALGVRMDEKQSKNGKGVRIVSIATDSPAEAAGLMAEDVIVAIGDERVEQFKRVHEIVSKRQPGEVVEVRYLREGKTLASRVRLASRTKVLQNWEGEDFANGGISLRTDNFPDVLQHDLPLVPADMGGPLFMLDGSVVGINIARVDRVTTFALPTEAFWAEVRQWIDFDRQPPKAQSVNVD
jgi:S1-C subfamily serine protease